MTNLHPNTQITPETVGMLKAGDVVRHSVRGLCTVRQIEDEIGLHVSWFGVDGVQLCDVFENFTYIGPDLGDGWVGWSGGENPVPGMRVDLKQHGYSGIGESYLSDNQDWGDRLDAGRIIAFRPAASSPSAAGVGEADDDAKREAWSDFEDEYLTDGKGYVLADTYKQCRAAFDAAWPGDARSAAYDAFRAAHPTPATVDWQVVGPKLVEALEKIERWFGEFPETGMFWPNADGTESDRPMSYGAAWGSNGERDFMRAVARDALAAATPGGK
jgi:hypothetical protein